MTAIELLQRIRFEIHELKDNGNYEGNDYLMGRQDGNIEFCADINKILDEIEKEIE